MPKLMADVLFFTRRGNYDTAVALNSVGRLRCLYAGGYVLQRWHGLVELLGRVLEASKIKRLNLRSTSITDSRCVPIWKHLLMASLIRNREERFFLERELFSRMAGTSSAAPVIIAEQVEALEAFEISGKRRATKVLMMTGESPAGRERLLVEEHLHWPPAEQISVGCKDMQRVVSRESAEIELADVLLSPSEFVTESLRTQIQCRDKPVFQVNWPIWGNDLIVSQPKYRSCNCPLRVLFVGSIGLRKGIMYLVKALEQMDPCSYEARFVGGTNLPSLLLEQCCKVARILGHLPYSEMQEQYRWADVFVLPSLSEGRARVVTEAMAAGLPVIVTRNTGAPVEDGVNGIVVPTREYVAVADALQRLAHDSALYESISDMAIKTMREMTLQRYAEELTVLLDSL